MTYIWQAVGANLSLVAARDAELGGKELGCLQLLEVLLLQVYEHQQHTCTSTGAEIDHGIVCQNFKVQDYCQHMCN